MHHSSIRYLFVLLNILVIILRWPTLCLSSVVDHKVLNIGEELWKESLPLQMGSRLYLLQGLKHKTWYEVKISYPASIPARFSLELKRDNTKSAYRQSRKLLDTEKLIFKTESLDWQGDQVGNGTHVLVTVEPAGIVAMTSVQEREFIIFNIVCDELLIGIPYKAWGIAVMVIVCLILAFILPSFLPLWLLQTNDQLSVKDHHVSKNS